VKACQLEGAFILRFRLFHRINHFIVIVSFLGLVATGIVLKYSNLPWALNLAKFFGGFAIAGFIHHFFGFVTFGYFIAHLIFVTTNFFTSGRA